MFVCVCVCLCACITEVFSSVVVSDMLGEWRGEGGGNLAIGVIVLEARCKFSTRDGLVCRDYHGGT